MSTTGHLFCALSLAILIMILTWVISIRTDKPSWVDAVWAYAIGALSLFLFGLNWADGPSWLPLLIVVGWSLRLGTHLSVRIASSHEDGRYTTLKKDWGGVKSPMMFGFFMIQAAAAFIFALPAYFAMKHTPAEWGILHLLAILWAIMALGGETLADAQLKRFAKVPENKGQVCKKGLWRYSRHPNYFFEWLFWFSFPILTWGTPGFIPTLVIPFIMLFLVTRMTGIPPTEAQALLKRGDRYRDYQKETSAFFPWFPRKLPENTDAPTPQQ